MKRGGKALAPLCPMLGRVCHLPMPCEAIRSRRTVFSLVPPGTKQSSVLWARSTVIAKRPRRSLPTLGKGELPTQDASCPPLASEHRVHKSAMIRRSRVYSSLSLSCPHCPN